MIEFWYEFASTYSYPAAMRVQRLADAAGVAVRWRPFLLGPIFGAQGWNDSPFNIYPVKGAYMWRDLQRICEREGLPLKLPPFRFPQNGLKAARIALAGEKENWIAAFTRAVYTANFGEERDITDDDLLRSLLERSGADPKKAVAAANSAENKAALKAQTDEAIAKGIFGAPSFTVGNELFWGNDRLEDAIAWAKRPLYAKQSVIVIRTIGGTRIAEVTGDGILLRNADDARDLLMQSRRADWVAVHAHNIAPEFFDLRSGIAGGVLQKFANYRTRFAVIGDILRHTGRSEAFAALVRESNRGKDVRFVMKIEDIR